MRKGIPTELPLLRKCRSCGRWFRLTVSGTDHLCPPRAPARPEDPEDDRELPEYFSRFREGAPEPL